MRTASPAPPDSAALDRYEPVIGIEVHCQLRTESKMFCACSTAYDGAAPNTHVCPVCLGLPGALPTINRAAVELVLATGIAIGASSPEKTRWERKNYFYPDLPKGYQISQYEIPLTANGRLAIETSDGSITVGITRAHLEEDTAKLIHAADTRETGHPGGRVSLLDFNRSGVPLMEIVTEPDIRSAEGARRYAEELQLLLRAIGASDADMERGQLRVEANVSLRPRGTEAFGTRVEVKNMNSFRSVERAIAFEIERQAAALDAGETLSQDTRGWDEDRSQTYVMRSKEDSHDYRYFPEPDLPPLRIDAGWLDEIRARLPEFPSARRDRYRETYGLSAYDAHVLVGEPHATRLFEGVLAAAPGTDPKAAANWVTGSWLALHKTEADAAGRVDAVELADLIGRIARGDLSGTNAKEVFAEHAATGRPVGTIVEAKGFHQISDAGALASVIDEVIRANPKAVEDYRAGKPVVGFFVGQVMKATRGQANASVVQDAVRAKLDEDAG
ncbi:MAG TPA: Asp-tRNA(Asn)/Glu-tRNA(Gln) amidotransferase subunit GatB [Candidatus Limnocylindrales bacterium]|nr:Asp-tRNA(Asn)/Glu-tRNA(Gln) amidotransferase subunit GatB [Candidatus Limnocylindrales bacterium]